MKVLQTVVSGVCLVAKETEQEVTITLFSRCAQRVRLPEDRADSILWVGSESLSSFVFTSL